MFQQTRRETTIAAGQQPEVQLSNLSQEAEELLKHARQLGNLLDTTEDGLTALHCLCMMQRDFDVIDDTLRVIAIAPPSHIELAVPEGRLRGQTALHIACSG